MAIESFEFDRGRSAACAAFRERLYLGDPNWIPSPPAVLASQFADNFWFYRRPGNRHRHFLATANGEIAGHVSAFVNGDLQDRDGSAVGTLGFCEFVDDYPAAAELLGHATAWLSDQGIKRIWAPVNFDIWHGYRFMTHGFAETTFYGEPYNKIYYPEFFCRFGFALKKTWDSLERSGRGRLETMISRFEPRYHRLVEDKYRFKALNVHAADERLELHRVLVQSYSVMLGATPLDFASFEALLGQYLAAFAAKFVNLVYDPNGNLAAFGVAYPDYSDALRTAGSVLDQAGNVPSHAERGQARRAILYMLGCTPEEVQKRHGTGSAIYYHTIRQILAAGFETLVVAIVADDSSARGLFRDEMKSVQRTYALYELNP